MWIISRDAISLVAGAVGIPIAVEEYPDEGIFVLYPSIDSPRHHGIKAELEIYRRAPEILLELAQLLREREARAGRI